ncbi:MAG: ABC transporter substrate-binding protein [Epsilonproteobacteria bacterium]|nr:ABC transporter substrate-binding protein [Campylobacterota bacterium]
MYQPIKKISRIIEKRYGCHINIIQGGSKDLYDSIKYSKKGDLFLPGSESYIKKCEKDGIVAYKKFVGYNQAAIFVQKHNPKKVTAIDDLLRDDIVTILCDPQSGSIGAMTKKILIKYKGKDFFEQAYFKAAEIGTDSRNLNSELIEKQVDMTINWLASAYWKENRDFIDVIKLDSKIAPKQRLVIAVLIFSKYPKIAKAFVDYAASNEGLRIMKEYGF